MMSLGFRSVLSAAAAALLLACSGSSTGGPGGPGGTGTGTGTGTGGSSSIDGTWDVTSAGGEEVGPSEITIKGGTVTGLLVSEEEGTKNANGCTYTKFRAEIAINIQGNALSGTITNVRQYTGATCPEDRSEVTAISGARTGTAKTGETVLEGTWEVRAGDEQPFLLDVTGLTAKVFADVKNTSAAPAVTVAIAGNSATATAKRDRYSLAARKR